MTQLAELLRLDVQQSAQRHTPAWLRSGTSLSIGVLLNKDAMLVRAPAKILASPSPDFDVIHQSSASTGASVAVAEVRLIADRLSAHQGLAVAMLRLATPVDVEAQNVERQAYWAQVRRSPDFWLTAQSIGLVPAELDVQAETEVPIDAPRTLSFPAVRTVKNGWCDIFWWLC